MHTPFQYILNIYVRCFRLSACCCWFVMCLHVGPERPEFYGFLRTRCLQKLAFLATPREPTGPCHGHRDRAAVFFFRFECSGDSLLQCNMVPERRDRTPRAACTRKPCISTASTTKTMSPLLRCLVMNPFGVAGPFLGGNGAELEWLKPTTALQVKLSFFRESRTVKT